MSCQCEVTWNGYASGAPSTVGQRLERRSQKQHQFCIVVGFLFLNASPGPQIEWFLINNIQTDEEETPYSSDSRPVTFQAWNFYVYACRWLDSASVSPAVKRSFISPFLRRLQNIVDINMSHTVPASTQRLFLFLVWAGNCSRTREIDK